MLNSNLISQCPSVVFELGNNPVKEFNICTDSRAFEADSIFIALKGEKFDAIQFVEPLLKKGAKIVVVEDSNRELAKTFFQQYPDIFFVTCNDTLKFTQELAHAYIKFWLSQSADRKVIAISGSNGKTTHKEMLYHYLKGIVASKVICTEKNNNNHLGVPLTIFQIKEDTQFAIIELGSNHPGEIKALCDIAIPNVGIVTNIGATHLEFFETVENVFLEEGYLYQAVKENTKGEGLFFVNMDDHFLSKLSPTKGTITFGEVNGEFKTSFTANSVSIENKGEKIILSNPHIIGKHNFHNLAATFLMACSLLPSKKEVFKNLAQTFKPKDNRSMWLDFHDKKIFLDAYNANPSSMRISLEGFIEFCEQNHFNLSRVLFVLGDMNELGNNGPEYHEEIGQFLKHKSVQNAVFIGRFQANYQKGFEGKGQLFNTSDEFKEKAWESLSKSYDYFFFKGSRSLQLERILGIKDH